MALIQCPECGGKVSTEAHACPHCGYPIQGKIKQNDISQLMSKISPCDFSCPSPRAMVCIKCGMPTESLECPSCRCSVNGAHYPFVEVDYPAAAICSHIGITQWIYEHCVIPRNIGDTTSPEYQSVIDTMYRSIQELNSSGLRNISPVPPDRRFFGVQPDDEISQKYLFELMENEKRTPKTINRNKPTCPICHSTNLSKLSPAKSFLKIATFGLAGAGDVGKTWKCNNCGSKF